MFLSHFEASNSCCCTCPGKRTSEPVKMSMLIKMRKKQVSFSYFQGSSYLKMKIYWFNWALIETVAMTLMKFSRVRLPTSMRKVTNKLMQNLKNLTLVKRKF